MRRYKYLLFSIISFMLFNINIVLADTMDACTNVGILKVIYFIKLLLNIAFIAVPIGLIVFGLIDFSKSIIFKKKEEYSLFFMCINIFFISIVVAVSPINIFSKITQ